MESTTKSAEKRTYAVIGTGAIGGYYGALLARSECEVHFLLHRDYDHVREHGLKVDSVRGNFVLPHVNAHRSPETMPKCDVVLVALKTTQNALLPKVIPSLLKENGAVVIMQNGLGVEEEVGAYAGDHPVMGGLCFICSNKAGPGHIRHLDYGHVTLAEYSSDKSGAGITPRMEETARDFENAGITVHLAENLGIVRWKKLVWNIPYNGLSVVLKTTTDQLISLPSGRSMIIDLMKEVIAGAAACGYSIEEEIIPQMLDATESMIPYHPSMKIDFDEKRPMEIEAIYSNPLRAALNAGATLPRVSMMYDQLRFLDAKNREFARGLSSRQ
ncbi:MAG: putative 2-dehydropantoate 2-reductase [Chitinispirillaceae bacterium]|nr:putative 2-dehydropantoate 2-reductase [Chitinispirillaceae bacterium]